MPRYSWRATPGSWSCRWTDGDAMMHRAALICGAAFLAGCLHEASTTCGNGGVCPPGLLCVDTGKTTTDGRICAAGTCGNARLDPGEVCDDGNNRSGDGCPADC